MIFPWLAFLIVIGLILALSKYELGIVLSIGAIIFALLAQVDILASLFSVITNPSILIIIIAVALIPILGGIMEESGLMLELVEKMDVSKKISLMASPAIFGLLPVPGGALMSAPLVEEIDKEMNPDQKVAINVWFRHILILIYPLSSALIISSAISKIPLYTLVVALIIPLVILFVIGYLFLIHKIEENKEEKTERDLKRVFHNLIPIIIAPIIDFLGRTFLDIAVPEIFLLIGLCISLIIAKHFAKMPMSQIKTITQKMRIWRFSLLIFAMFWFLEVFVMSGVPEVIGALNMSFFLFIVLGFCLGFATGRIQLPVSIMVPIYLIQYGLTVMILVDFIFLYCAIFLGYLITPIHPCVSYSTDYFKTDFKSIFKYLFPPTFACFGILLALYTLSTFIYI